MAPLRRTLTRGAMGLPLAPEAKTEWSGEIYAPMATDEQKVVLLAKQILQGDTSDNAVSILGGYLTALLLGPFWSLIEARLAGSSEPVELLLKFDPSDGVMQRLPWEMMMSGGNPLGALQGRSVAITRVVAGPPAGGLQISIPLRILIVIGMQIDQSLRPGAEYLGILRQLRVGDDAGAAPESIDVNIRLLPGATIVDIQNAVADFDPAVVHFIAHGQRTNQQSEILLTGQADANSAAVEPDPCTPTRLITAMRRTDGTGRLPPVVVLNACHTGERNAEYMPFAAELVSLGVPVALGMAGEVADAASRAFTRAFYQSLIDERPLSEAAAYARRAVMLHPNNYDFRRSAEWVRPTIFMLEGTPPKIVVDRGRRSIAAAAFRFRTLREPAVLCGRMQTFQAYDKHRRRIASGDYRSPLVLEVSDNERSVLGEAHVKAKLQMGKSRFLSEMAASAVLDGIVPCLLASGEGLQLPLNLLTFAIRVAEVMDDTREFFGLHRRVASEALNTAFDEPVAFDPDNPQPFKRKRDDVKALLNQPGVKQVSEDRVRDAIGADTNRLLHDLQALMPDSKPADAPYFRSVLVLIDDLHQYESISRPLLSMVLKYGLAGNGGRAALAFSYSTLQDAGPDIAAFIKDNRRAFAIESLRPFQSPVESRLAYTQFMLARSQPLAPSAQKEFAEQVDVMFRYLHQEIRGVPSFFELGEQYFKMGRDLSVFVQADDERIIRGE
jgi:hypothetical protein